MQLTDAALGRLAPGLRHLDARYCAGFEGGPGLGARLPALSSLAVERCADFTGAGLGGLLALQALEVTHCPWVASLALAAAAGGCPALKVVTYTCSSGSTGGAPTTSSSSSAAPVMAAALGPGWEVVPRMPFDPAETGWLAARSVAVAAAPPADGDSEGGGGEAPAAKRARVGGE